MLRICRAAAIAFSLIIVSAFGRPAAAHPLGNFTINHLAKIALRGDRLQVRYFLDFAEIPTFQIMRSLDAQAHPTAQQLEAWARSETDIVRTGLRIQHDARRLTLEPGVARVRLRPGAGGLPILYWTETFGAALPADTRAGSPVTLSVVDDTYANRIGWKDISVAPATEPTRELLQYPIALLGSPRDVSAVTIDIRGGLVTTTDAAPAAEPAPTGTTSQARSNTLSDMLASGTSSLPFVILTLLAAVGLGALHALEPGHGKTLLAVSLVGARATPKQAVILASALTVAHTVGVLLLGVALLFVANWFVPENIYPWITLVSGVAVAVLGANALARIVRARRGAAHEHGTGAHHSHGIPVDPNRPLSFGGVVVAAASGNIAPCPAALVVLLTALTLHQLTYGLIVIVAFSIGLAAVLTGLGIALVHGAQWISRNPAFDRIARYGPLASASVISIIGAVMFGQALAAGSLHVPAPAVTALALIAIGAYSMSPGHEHGTGVHRSHHSHAVS